MMRSVSTSLTTQDLADAMFGGLVTVEKMGPDPSSVHVNNFGDRPRRKVKRVQSVEKLHIPMKALRVGRLSSMAQTLGMGGAHAGGQALGQAGGIARHGTQPMKQLVKESDKLLQAGEAVPKVVAPGEAPKVAPKVNGRGAPLPTPIERGIAARSSTATKVGGGALAATLVNRRSQGDVYKLDDRQKRQLTAGASAVGAVAGAAGLAYAGHDIRTGRKAAKLTGVKYKVPAKTKAFIPLELAGLGGEVSATHILHGDTKKQKVEKFDVEIAGTFSKFDEDKKRAYGWASVVTMDGEPVVDRQGDYIGLDDIEEAAYTYVRKSRVTGDMHRRTTGLDGEDSPHKAGELIESVVFTPDKCHAMGLPASFAGKWWMGVQVEDDEVWAEVKKGNRTGFSIHGKGLRKDTTMDDIKAGR